MDRRVKIGGNLPLRQSQNADCRGVPQFAAVATATVPGSVTISDERLETWRKTAKNELRQSVKITAARVPQTAAAKGLCGSRRGYPKGYSPFDECRTAQARSWTAAEVIISETGFHRIGPGAVVSAGLGVEE